MTLLPSSPAKKAKFKHSTPRRRNRIIARYSSGLSAKAVAVHEGVEEVHVRGVVKRFKTQDYGISKPGRGRPTKLTDVHKRSILREVAKDPFIQIETLRRLCCAHVSRATLTRYLKTQKISHTFAATRPYLSTEHAAARYAWSIEHSDHDITYWRKVLFTDESTIERGGNARRKWVFRPKG